jgi:signal peptidase I
MSLLRYQNCRNIEEFNTLKMEDGKNSSYILDFDIEHEAILTLRAILNSGNSVELTAIGYSMFPTFRQGDRVVVRPLKKDELPLPGNVLVCLKETQSTLQTESGVLVLHRLRQIKNDPTGKLTLITRGDSLPGNDAPWELHQLIGIAVKYKRSGKEFDADIFIPGNLHYLYNASALWLLNKLTRLKRLIIKI